MKLSEMIKSLLKNPRKCPKCGEDWDVIPISCDYEYESVVVKLQCLKCKYIWKLYYDNPTIEFKHRNKEYIIMDDKEKREDKK